MDNINNLIRKSADVDMVGAAQLNLKDADVVHIWDEVSLYIERFMTQLKGVSIPGFGTFSFIQKKIDIGNNKCILVQRPVFSIAEKFAQTHGLICTKYPVAGNIPVHPLNYAAIANETAFSRDDVEICVKHILQVLNRSVQSKRNVEFTFNTIGKLQIRDSKIKMKFFKEFIGGFEESGKIISDMQNRPNTADSVISRNQESRIHSRNTCLLPRLNSRIGTNSAMDNLNNGNNNVMDTIQEDYGEDEALNFRSLYQQEEETNNKIPVVSIYSPNDPSNTTNYNINNLNQNSENISDDLMPQHNKRPSTTASSGYRIPNLFTSKSLTTLNIQPKINNLETVQNESSPPQTTPLGERTTPLMRPSSKTLIHSLVPKQVTSTCGHHNAGQELCYLCHQRMRRNVPVYLHEETRLKELEENQLLLQYQSLKDLDKQLKDEEKRNIQRMDRAKIDSFNLGVAEAIKNKKQERPKTSDMSRSFVFRKRCRTPPKTFKQIELNEFLTNQINQRQKDSLMSKEEQLQMEKMEQLQLAEDLAAQRDAFLKSKYQRQIDLKNALDTQIKNKPPYLPKVLPDGEVFGHYDAKNEKLAWMKRKEIEQHNYNKEIIEQRKREALLNQLKEQEKDSENIEKIREELRVDRANRYMRMVDMRKNLEKNWNNASQEKKLRDIDEKGHRLAHDGLLVHEQCDKYKRCAQCQKDVKNCGESNIWADTRYVAGTRLMA